MGAALVVLAGTPLLAGRTRPALVMHDQQHAMGTMFGFAVHHASPSDARHAIAAARAEIVRLDDVLSHYKATSELSRLHSEGGRGYVVVDPSLFEVVEQSIEFSRLSDGRFDITVGPLVRAWRAAHDAGRSPSEDELARLRPCVGYERIALERPDRIRLDAPCMALDLGGIGKGYAVDRALAVLRRHGIAHAVVNAGGSTIAGMGASPGSAGWPVQIGTRASARQVVLRDAAVSTSEQVMLFHGRAPGVFGEIIDPRRAAPAETRTTVSVVTPSATSADALSTTLLLSSVAQGVAVIEHVPGASALWTSASGDVIGTYGCWPAANARDGERP